MPPDTTNIDPNVIVASNYGDEIIHLRAELAQRTAERDEARRDCCAFEGILRFNNAHPKGIISQEATLRRANEIAAERGWDCFDAKEER
jgi:hypothetical protein